MADLSLDDFDDFFREIHGYAPFPWQRRLLGQVVAEGRWPDPLDLPTGTGKTAALDVALFHLALEAGGADRRAPLRTVLVVDRRTIVDQAFQRARRIRKALEEPTSPVLQAVRAQLASLSREGTPLHVAALRGGMARDDAWARSPDQPLIAVSTVDQVGSRLLFRGYGVSSAMRPVHAGLLGSDTLFLLDEVHLSQPFRQTLQAIGTRYRQWAEQPLPDRWQVVPMSATPGAEAPAGFGLDTEDEAHPLLRRRLEASKPVQLQEVKASGDEGKRRAMFVRAFAEAVMPHVRTGGATVAVVVNRVQTARDVFGLLRDMLEPRRGGVAAADVMLLTGRMRPLDRAAVERDLVPRIAAGRTRDAGARPLVVVATQCIEAGADFDFDVLITECASLDALRQRFGRLDRLGEAEACQGLVLVRSDAVRGEPDPIYGNALAETWQYLSGLDEVNFGIRGLRLPEDPAAMSSLLAPRENAPVLLPAHLDTWVQTSPGPVPEPDVSLWLHGPERGTPEVQIVWRADITEKLLRRALEKEEVASSVMDAVEVCAPSSGEALSVPLYAARRWLAEREGAADFGDVEGFAAEAAEKQSADREGERPALAWRGEHNEVCLPAGIRPGDTLVVPATYGGIAAGNWDPAARDVVVSDLGDRAGLLQRGRSVLRLHPAVIDADLGLASGEALPAWAQPLELADSDDPEIDDAGVVRVWLEGVVEREEVPDWLRQSAEHLLREMRTRRRSRIVRLSLDEEKNATYLAVVARRRMRFTASEVTTEDDTASFTGVQVTLRAHLAGVAAHARDFAQRCGFPETVVSDVALAASWHDAGKADPRFQVLLHGGSRFKATVAPEPIAKSGTPPGDRQARDRARRRSEYPVGCRHEVMSVALMEQQAPLRQQAHDWDLVLHLVASHHGWCRPLAPVVMDPDPVEVAFADGEARVCASSDHGLARLDSGIGERFWRLVRRYGWFGLAWLEAVLRLADHRRSENEQRGLAQEGHE